MTAATFTAAPMQDVIGNITHQPWCAEHWDADDAVCWAQDVEVQVRDAAGDDNHGCITVVMTHGTRPGPHAGAEAPKLTLFTGTVRDGEGSVEFDPDEAEIAAHALLALSVCGVKRERTGPDLVGKVGCVALYCLSLGYSTAGGADCLCSLGCGFTFICGSRRDRLVQICTILRSGRIPVVPGCGGQPVASLLFLGSLGEHRLQCESHHGLLARVEVPPPLVAVDDELQHLHVGVVRAEGFEDGVDAGLFAGAPTIPAVNENGLVVVEHDGFAQAVALDGVNETVELLAVDQRVRVGRGVDCVGAEGGHAASSSLPRVNRSSRSNRAVFSIFRSGRGRAPDGTILDLTRPMFDREGCEWRWGGYTASGEPMVTLDHELGYFTPIGVIWDEVGPLTHRESGWDVTS